MGINIITRIVLVVNIDIEVIGTCNWDIIKLSDIMVDRWDVNV